ncbi:YdcF family protein [Frankia sp. AgKG'84/4]|uniref:YdcF family protein n=1 Tax=Frankia sp. AgKG'84/4 TaxID=573490 RepID=UPI0027E4460A|nr:YdcF family protein [Frankia sp. AgKG'84/4]
MTAAPPDRDPTVPAAPTTTGPTVRPAAPRPSGRRRAIRRGLIGVLVLAFAATTARLFIFPDQDRPARVDAIVMFAGSPGRLERAVGLARAGYAPLLAISTPTADDPCPQEITGVEVVCFAPDPLTTQGESRWLAAAAAQRGWHSVIVITATTQTTRARLRLGRCYPGEARMIGVAPAKLSWPYMIAYEWAALGKALILQRGC